MSEVKKEPDMGAVCSVCSQQYGSHQAGAANRCPHPKGDWLFLDTWFTPSAAPDAPVACEMWCGLPYEDTAVPPRWHNNGWPFGHDAYTDNSAPAYCTQACADRAAKPASGEGRRLSDGWERADAGRYDWECCYLARERARRGGER